MIETAYNWLIDWSSETIRNMSKAGGALNKPPSGSSVITPWNSASTKSLTARSVRPGTLSLPRFVLYFIPIKNSCNTTIDQITQKRWVNRQKLWKEKEAELLSWACRQEKGRIVEYRIEDFHILFNRHLPSPGWDQRQSGRGVNQKYSLNVQIEINRCLARVSCILIVEWKTFM